MRRYLAGWLAVLFIASHSVGVLSHANDSEADPPAWASPTAMALKRTSQIEGAQHESNLFHNINCGLLEYRQTGAGLMTTGCFSETSFGMLDADSSMVIFNGTDEALPLIPNMSGQVLAPWPAAGNLLALDSYATGGSLVSLYKGIGVILQDQRSALGVLQAKRISRPPDLVLRDPSGQPLVINSETLAFSEGGSWMVAENLNGSFVRINLATLEELPFAPAYGTTGSPGLMNSAVTISRDGRFVAISNEAAGAFKVYDLAACTGTISNLTPLNCRSHDYRAFIAQQLGGVKMIRHVRFVNEGLISFEATAANPANDGTYVIAPTGSITSLINYLGLGDSYTSGEGAFDYLSGTDTKDNVCHLSAKSYPVLLTHDVFGSPGGHSVACSGAVINDLANTGNDYRGQAAYAPSWQELEQHQQSFLNSIMTNFLPGYVAQQRFVSQYQPGVITVSVGGDDIGFGDLVEQCVGQHISLHLSDNTCFNTYEDRLELRNLIDHTVPKWVSLYNQLLAESPGSRIYAIGYPQIASDQGNCAMNVHLNKSELEFTEEIVDYLNSAIKQSAAKAKVAYVDISQALVGHRLCETASYNVAVNGLTAGRDAGIFGVNFLAHESYHPNALGQQLIEQAIIHQTNHFLLNQSANGSPPNGAVLLNKPKSGRETSVRQPAAKITSRVVKAGQGTAIHISGKNAGLRSDTAYQARLDGAVGTEIGTVYSDNNGDISGEIILPPTTPGGHTVDITGLDQTDQSIDITQPVYVPANDADADNDGLGDTVDSCPYAPNSGEDADSDGIDDSCDSVISQPPVNHNKESLRNGVDLMADSASLKYVKSKQVMTSNKTIPSTTTTTNKGAPDGFALAHTAKTSQILPRRHALRTINLLPLLLLPVLFWLLLLLLVLCLRFLYKTCTKSSGFRLK